MGVSNKDVKMLDYINEYLYLSSKGDYELGKMIAILLCNCIASEDKEFLNGIKDRIDESL